MARKVHIIIFDVPGDGILAMTNSFTPIPAIDAMADSSIFFLNNYLLSVFCAIWEGRKCFI